MLRNTVDIMVHYLRLTYGERTTLLFQLAMPLLFTFLIGQATGGFSNTVSSTAVRWTIAVANEDNGSLGALLVEFLKTDPALAVHEVDETTAVAEVTAENAVAALVIPPDFSDTLWAEQTVSLSFYSDPQNIRTVQPVTQAVKGSISQLDSLVKAAAVSTAAAAQLGLFEQGVDPQTYKEEAISKAQKAWTTPPTAVQVNEDEIVLNKDNAIPDGINQSSPGMMAMFATFSMIGGAAVLIQERQWGTLRRLAVMPIRKSSIIGGKLAGIVTAGIVQMAVLILAGALLFNVAWGHAPAALAVMVVSFALAMSALGMMMAALAKTMAQANALGTVLVLSMSALGGAWWPLDIVPGWMQTVGRLSPIYWAMSGFHDIITRSLSLTAVLPEAIVLWGFTAVFLAVGIWRFTYE